MPRPTPEEGNVIYHLPGVSRIDTGVAHWRTSVSLLNAGSLARGVLLRYLYTVGGTTGTNRVAESFQILEPGKLLAVEDIAELFPDVADLTPTPAGTAGGLRISHAADAEPLGEAPVRERRNFDDRRLALGGTAGTQIVVIRRTGGRRGRSRSSSPAPSRTRGSNQRRPLRARRRATVINVSRDRQGGQVLGPPVQPRSKPGRSERTPQQCGLSAFTGLPPKPVSLRVEVLRGGALGVRRQRGTEEPRPDVHPGEAQD